jgi:putative salt-induced outer membrane protein
MHLNVAHYKSIFVFIFISLILLRCIFLQTAMAEFLSASKEGSESASELFSNSPPSDLDKPNKKWLGQAEVGFSASKGNNSNSNTTISIASYYTQHFLKHTLKGEIYLSKSQGEKTSESLSLDYKLDYLFNKKQYLFNLLSYSRDKFSNIDARIADIIGYGHHLIKNEKHTLNSEFGFGIRQTKSTNKTKKSKEPASYFALHYNRKLTATTTLKEDFSILMGKNNTFSELKTALNLKMTEKLSLSVKYTVHHNQKTQSGFKKMGMVMSVNLVSDF